MYSGVGEYYTKANRVSDFNDSADEDHYWLPYIRRYCNDYIRIGVEFYDGLGMRADDYPLFVVPMFFFNVCFGFRMRSLRSSSRRVLMQDGFACYTSYKGFTTFRDNGSKVLPYVVVCEGEMDAEVASNIHPYSLACCGAMPTMNMVKAISLVARNIVLIPDNDERGDETASSFPKIVAKNNIKIGTNVVRIHKKIKDLGDIVRSTVDASVKKDAVDDLKYKLALVY